MFVYVHWLLYSVYVSMCSLIYMSMCKLIYCTRACVQATMYCIRACLQATTVYTV